MSIMQLGLMTEDRIAVAQELDRLALAAEAAKAAWMDDPTFMSQFRYRQAQDAYDEAKWRADEWLRNGEQAETAVGR